jgi:hypothetical protein
VEYRQVSVACLPSNFLRPQAQGRCRRSTVLRLFGQTLHKDVDVSWESRGPEGCAWVPTSRIYVLFSFPSVHQKSMFVPMSTGKAQG